MNMRRRSVLVSVESIESATTGEWRNLASLIASRDVRAEPIMPLNRLELGLNQDIVIDLRDERS